MGLGLVCLTLVALLLSANPTWGQEVTASITGTVSDPSGAAIAGATVTAKSVERGLTYSAETNDSGIYRIAQLPVGSYELKVEKSGFASSSYTPFVLTLNQVARIDVALKVGQVTQTVEVTGAAPVLKTETTPAARPSPERRLPQSRWNAASLIRQRPTIPASIASRNSRSAV